MCEMWFCGERGANNCVKKKKQWIDRESGIAATLFVNVLPQGDATVVKLYDELERAVYGDLLGKKGD